MPGIEAALSGVWSVRHRIILSEMYISFMRVVYSLLLGSRDCAAMVM